MDHIKRHYYGSHPSLNPKGIVPLGPNPWWESQNWLNKYKRLYQKLTSI